jgi:deoxycytidine triphosphate deaminase
MVLTREHILQRITNGEIKFLPELDQFQLQPHSIDLRLGYKFHLPKSWELTKEGRKVLQIDPLEKNTMNYEEIELQEGQYFELLPSEYIVATTLEKIELYADDLMGVLYPRSSVNRRGLSVDLTGLIDVCYKGYLMIPISNNTDNQIIRVYPGERICTVVFEELTSHVTSAEAEKHGVIKAKYTNNDTGFIGSKTDKSEEIEMIRNGKLKVLKEKYHI